jgi:hypothetical protein
VRVGSAARGQFNTTSIGLELWDTVFTKTENCVAMGGRDQRTI